MLILQVALMLLTCQQFTVSVAPAVPKFTVSVVPVVVKPSTVTGPELMISYASFHCPPCEQLKADIAAGRLSGFTITLTGDFPLNKGYPAIRFRKNGKLIQINGWDRNWAVWLRDNVDGAAKCCPPVRQIKHVVQQQSVELPERWAVWQGQSYDMEFFSGCGARGCNMCANLMQQKRRYQALKAQAGYQQTVFIPDHQQPTPADMIDRMLTLMRLTSSDVLYDAGCGDGRILTEAVSLYRCRGIGVEIDPVKADEARRRVASYGLSDRIEIITGDALEFDPTEHGVTAMTAYLFPSLLEQLAPKFREAGIRVGASPFHEVPGLGMTEHDDVWVYRRPE